MIDSGWGIGWVYRYAYVQTTEFPTDMAGDMSCVRPMEWSSHVRLRAGEALALLMVSLLMVQIGACPVYMAS